MATYANMYYKGNTLKASTMVIGDTLEQTYAEISVDVTAAQGRGGWTSIPGYGILSYEVRMGFDNRLQCSSYMQNKMRLDNKNWLRDYDPTYTRPWYGGADGDFDKKLGATIRFWLDGTGAKPTIPGTGLFGIMAAEMFNDVNWRDSSLWSGSTYSDWSTQCALEEGILKVREWDSEKVGSLYYYIEHDYEGSRFDSYDEFRDYYHQQLDRAPSIFDIRKSGSHAAYLDVPIVFTTFGGAYHFECDLFLGKIADKNDPYALDAIACVSVKVRNPTPYEYTLSFDTRGGSQPPSAITHRHGVRVELPKDVPTVPEGEFKGWYDPKTEIVFAPKSYYFGNYNDVLEAAWDTTISFVANGGSGAPGPIVKRYREAVRLPIDEPQKPGYIFVAWNTSVSGNGTSYAAGGTVPANIIDSFTLYAVWQKDIDPPTVKSLTTIRCERDGTPADEGTCCLVTCVWEVDTVNNSANRGTVTGKYAPRRGEERTFQFRSGASGTSGTATALVEGLDVDTQFTFTATVTDIKRSTSMSSILTRARFVLDFKTGGLGMGIGSAAPLNGLAVGWETQFDDDVIIYGNLDAKEIKYSYNAYDANSSPTSYEMVNPQGTFTVGDVYVQRVGQLVQLSVRITTSVALTAGTNETVGTIASSIRPRRDIGISSDKAVGRITSGGNISVTPLFDMSSGSSITVGATYFTGV